MRIEGQVEVARDPTANLELATKQYADAIQGGVVTLAPIPLAVATFTPATDSTVWESSSTTFSPVHADLQVSFTAKSDSAIVSTAALANPKSNEILHWAILDADNGDAKIADTEVYIGNDAYALRRHTEVVITGLTPGQTYNWKWGARTRSGGAASSIYGGPTYGQLIMAVFDGSTGAELQSALTSLSYEEVIGTTGSGTEFTISHNLGSDKIIVGVWDEASNPPELVHATVQRIDKNNIKLIFAESPDPDQYRVIVHGSALIPSTSLVKPEGLTLTASQSVAGYPASTSTISWDSVVQDDGGWHDSANPTVAFTAPSEGWYLCSLFYSGTDVNVGYGDIIWNFQRDGGTGAWNTITGANTRNQDSEYTPNKVIGAIPIYLLEGESFRIIGYHDNNSTRNYSFTFNAVSLVLPVTAGGGGSPVPGYIADRKTPSDTMIWADEFDEDSLSDDWTIINITGMFDVKVGRSVASMKFDGTGNSQMAGIGTTLPSGLTKPYAIETFIRTRTIYEHYLMSGLFVSDGLTSTSNVMWWMPYQHATGMSYSLRSGTIGNIATTLANVNGHPNDADDGRLHRFVMNADGTLTVEYSLDGVQWSLAGSTSFQNVALGFTPTHFGMGVSTWSMNSTGYDRLVSMDYIRVYEIGG